MVWGLISELKGPQILVLTLGAIAFTFYIVNNVRSHNLKFPRRDVREDRNYNVLDTYFSKKSIRVLDFLNPEDAPILREKVFEDCIIYGPCLLYPVEGQNVLNEITFRQGRSIEDMVYELPTTERGLIGVVGMDSCTFKRCEFHHVGLMAQKHVIDAARSQIKVKNDNLKENSTSSSQNGKKKFFQQTQG